MVFLYFFPSIDMCSGSVISLVFLSPPSFPFKLATKIRQKPQVVSFLKPTHCTFFLGRVLALVLPLSPRGRLLTTFKSITDVV